MKIVKNALCILFCLVLLALPVSAHSGRTDASGGHKDNKNVSGLGPYHYHHGYPAHLHPGGACPYSAPAPAASSPTTSSYTAPIQTGKTDAQKAAFLDAYIALIQTGDTVYHTLDCADFDASESFLAYNVSAAKEKGYTACTKCHP
ncbi:YHYH domain-containing protein [Anaerotruncus rubiinfantis]|uniref:YHYH domain-containing protein n=1 Tax=Anaerotruncus rubiinfantis TaxID=1720200 RepID=UPI0034A5D30A